MFLILSYKEYEEISTVKSGSRDQVKILTDILDFEDTKSAGLPGARLIIFSDVFTFYSRAFLPELFHFDLSGFSLNELVHSDSLKYDDDCCADDVDHDRCDLPSHKSCLKVCRIICAAVYYCVEDVLTCLAHLLMCDKEAIEV